jgi:hypothetical protein
MPYEDEDSCQHFNIFHSSSSSHTRKAFHVCQTNPKDVCAYVCARGRCFCLCVCSWLPFTN